MLIEDEYASEVWPESEISRGLNEYGGAAV